MVDVAFRNRLNAWVDAEDGPRAGRCSVAAGRCRASCRSRDSLRTTANDSRRANSRHSNTRACGQHREHRVTQAEGRDRFSSEYTLSICEVKRESRFSAAQAGRDGSDATCRKGD